MVTPASWESIPSEIWFTIMEKLPLKSQVSLACACKKFYKFSLDPFLENLEERTQIYLGANKSLPGLLAKTITILRIPAPQLPNEATENQSRFFQEEISRMSNLRMLIVEKRIDKMGHIRGRFLSESAVHEVVQKKYLEELKVPGLYLTHRSPTGKSLLHLAVEKGNNKLVRSLLSQMEVYLQHDREGVYTNLFKEINMSDTEGSTPLKIAIEQENQEIILLLKKGARGEEYLLSKENSDLSPIINDTIDKGSHLHVKHLTPVTLRYSARRLVKAAISSA